MDNFKVVRRPHFHAPELQRCLTLMLCASRAFRLRILLQACSIYTSRASYTPILKVQVQNHSLMNPVIVQLECLQDNVLISSTGVPMLSDFGVSRVIAASNITTGTSAGCSTRWMAYELFPPLDEVPQLDGTSYRRPVTANEKTDVWAFGMTVYVSNDRFSFARR
jgi:hypothetical protein